MKYIPILFVLLAIMWVPKSHATSCPSPSYNGGFNGNGYDSIYASCESYLNQAQGGVTYAGDCTPDGTDWTQILFTRNSDGTYFRCNVYDTTECVSPQIRNTSTGACENPPPPPCSGSAGDKAGFSGSGTLPASMCNTVDNCSYTITSGMTSVSSGNWYGNGVSTGNSCSSEGQSSPEPVPPAGTNCVVDAQGNELCDGDIKDTYNGKELPGGDLPDNSCEYLSDGSLVCDSVVGDTSNGDNVTDLVDDNNPDYPQTVHNDYSSLPPGTGVDTNGDGITDAIATDNNSDGITDEIRNADGTTFAQDNPDGTTGTTEDIGQINDDGSPNYDEAQTAGNEDGSGEGLGECNDDPGTPEDECGDINKSGATTPYCDSAPTCEGDPLACANLYQNWQILCASAPAKFHTDSLDKFKDGVDDGSEFYNPETDNHDLGEFDFNASATGWGYSRTCPSDIPFNTSLGSFAVPLSDYCNLMQIISYLILIASAYISAMIIFRGVNN